MYVCVIEREREVCINTIDYRVRGNTDKKRNIYGHIQNDRGRI